MSLIVLLLGVLHIYFTNGQEQRCNRMPCLSRHTACKYGDTISKYCEPHIGLVLTKEDRQAILHAINYQRNEIALGHYGLPPAISMPIILWDFDLEYIAKAWANQCLKGRDECRDKEYYKYGQVSKYWEAHTLNWSQAISEIYQLTPREGIVLYNKFVLFRKGPQSFDDYTGRVGLYSYAVNFVGCGLTVVAVHWTNGFYLVCNFGPVNAYQKSEVLYKTGDAACSKCYPNMFCDFEFRGLCTFWHDGLHSRGYRNLKNTIMFVTIYLYLFIL